MDEDTLDATADRDDEHSSDQADQEGDVGDDQEEGRETAAKFKTPEFSFQNISDFAKFTEGMDEMGSSEEEDEEEDASMEEGSNEEESGEESEEDVAGAKESEEDGGVVTFSEEKVSEEVEKGKAVKNQIGLYMEFALYFDEPYALSVLEKLTVLRSILTHLMLQHTL